MVNGAENIGVNQGKEENKSTAQGDGWKNKDKKKGICQG